MGGSDGLEWTCGGHSMPLSIVPVVLNIRLRNLGNGCTGRSTQEPLGITSPSNGGI